MEVEHTGIKLDHQPSFVPSLARRLSLWRMGKGGGGGEGTSRITLHSIVYSMPCME